MPSESPLAFFCLSCISQVYCGKWESSDDHVPPQLRKVLVGLSMSRMQLAWPRDPGTVPPGARAAVLLHKPWPGQSGHRAWCRQGVNQQSRSCELFSIHQQRLLLVKAGRQSRAIN